MSFALEQCSSGDESFMLSSQLQAQREILLIPQATSSERLRENSAQKADLMLKFIYAFQAELNVVVRLLVLIS